VIAVAAAGAPAMVESWQTGTIVEYPTASTIADGIAVRVPIPEAVTDMREAVDDALLVRDEMLLTGMRLLHQHLGLVVEPSAAAGVAALLENPARFKDQTVASILCGGNLTPQQVSEWLF
jgi:threonine dehydratase